MHRHPRLRIRVRVATAAAAVLVSTAACGGNQSTERKQSEERATDGFPVSITHALGTTTLKRKPTRIVTLSEDLDTLAAIGIKPVGYVPAAPGYTDDVPYQKEHIDLSDAEVLEGTSAREFSLERIASLQPDLILATNLFGLESIYDQLQRIAPTVGYEKGWGQTSWQDMSRTIGKAVGEPAAAAAAVAEAEQYLRDLRAELPGLDGLTVASAFYHSAGTFAANPHSASMDKYLALGMKVKPELLRAIPKGSRNNSVSLEQIQVLDADVLLLSFGTAALKADLEANLLYRNLRAVRNNAVQVGDLSDELPKFAGNNPTLLNIPWLLEQHKDTLIRAATAAAAVQR